MRMHPLEVFSSNSAFLSRRQKQNQTVNRQIRFCLFLAPGTKRAKKLPDTERKRSLCARKIKSRKKCQTENSSSFTLPQTVFIQNSSPIPFLGRFHMMRIIKHFSYLLTVFSAATKTEVLTFKLNAGKYAFSQVKNCITGH